MTRHLTVIQPAKISFEDGQAFSELYQDPYHSSFGAIEEKRHVFINGNDLENRFNHLENQQSFVIAEIGFGLGINFLLSWQLWQRSNTSDKQLHFISTELHPLIKQDLENILKTFPELEIYSKQLIQHYPSLTPGFHRLRFGNVSLTLLLGDALASLKSYVCDDEPELQKALQNFSVNAWFLDGFAPTKNPALWQEPLLNVISLLSDQHTTLTTYSASRRVKDVLSCSGFDYAKKKGIGKKREFLFAVKKQFFLSTKKFKHLESPWHCAVNKVLLRKNHSIAVVGAGLAGCMMAHRLAERGFSVTLFEKERELATQASGNLLGMVHFNLSPFHSLLNDFMLTAFLYANRFYQSIPGLESYMGIADLLDPQQHENKKAQLAEFSKQYPEIIQFLSKDEISKLSKVDLSKPAIYWPLAQTVSPVNLCRQLSIHENIQIEYTNFTSPMAQAFDKVIYCLGIDTINKDFGESLDISPVPGMVSYLPANDASKKLAISITGQGYITPSNTHDVHLVGGSYHINSVQDAHHQHVNLAEKFSQNFSALRHQAFQYKQGIRAKTYDYLPYVGALPECQAFEIMYAKLGKDKNLRINKIPPYSSKFYVLTGFGSHGLTTIPLSVEIILCHLLKEPLPVSQHVMKGLSPSRSLLKRVILRNL